MKFLTSAPNRRILTRALAAHIGAEPVYAGPPTFGYIAGPITIDRDGYADVPDELAADVKAFLISKEWIEADPSPEKPRTQISVPLDGMSVPAVTNLIFMLYSKQHLLGKALGTACIRIGHAAIAMIQQNPPEDLTAYTELLHDLKESGDIEGIELTEERLQLDFPEDDGANTELWMLLATKMAAAARAAHRVYPQYPQPEMERYYMRGWMIRLGMGGTGYREARKKLLQNLNGVCGFASAEKALEHRKHWSDIRHRQAEARKAEQGEITEDL